MEKIDIAYTTKPADRPHPEARLVRDLATGVADWEIPEDSVVDLVALRNAELDEAFKPVGEKVDKEIIAPSEEVPDFLKPVKGTPDSTVPPAKMPTHDPVKKARAKKHGAA